MWSFSQESILDDVPEEFPQLMDVFAPVAAGEHTLHRHSRKFADMLLRIVVRETARTRKQIVMNSDEHPEIHIDNGLEDARRQNFDPSMNVYNSLFGIESA